MVTLTLFAGGEKFAPLIASKEKIAYLPKNAWESASGTSCPMQICPTPTCEATRCTRALASASAGTSAAPVCLLTVTRFAGEYTYQPSGPITDGLAEPLLTGVVPRCQRAWPKSEPIRAFALLLVPPFAMSRPEGILTECGTRLLGRPVSEMINSLPVMAAGPAATVCEHGDPAGAPCPVTPPPPPPGTPVATPELPTMLAQ